MTGVQWSYLEMHPLMVHSKPAELASLFFGGSSISDIHQEHMELITCWVKSKELVHIEEDLFLPDFAEPTRTRWRRLQDLQILPPMKNLVVTKLMHLIRCYNRF
jgi:hypothetical protein